MAAAEEDLTFSLTSGRDAQAHRSIGSLLVDAGKLSEHDAQRVSHAQRLAPARFGELAVSLGLVDSEDVQRALSIQFAYPYVRPGESSLSTRLVAAYDPFGRTAEALRSLRSQLLFKWFSDKRRTLAVVAARSDDGSSVLTANLAIAFAQLGKRTLLIDAHLRSPLQHELFGLPAARGLADLLAGHETLRRTLLPIEPFKGLTLLPAGCIPPNPQELLGRDGFSRLLACVGAGFDSVIVDSPPLCSGADAQIVAVRAGGCLLAARLHETRQAEFAGALARLADAGAQVLGAVACD